MSRLSEFAVAKRSVILLLAAAVFIAGIIAWGNLKQELLPDIELPVITVIAPLPGAGAADVAEQVTKPIERAISGVPRLEALQSTSANSIALVIAQFSFGTDVKETRAQIEQNIGAANLPPSVTPTVAALNINASPVIIASVAATTPDGLSEAARIVQTEIQPALLGIEGVASVDVSGGNEQQVADHARPGEARQGQRLGVAGRRRPDREQPDGPVRPGPGRRDEDPGVDDRRLSAASTRSATWSSASRRPWRRRHLACPAASGASRRGPVRCAAPAPRSRSRSATSARSRPWRAPDHRLRADGDPGERRQPVALAVGDEDVDRQYGPGRRRRDGQAQRARRAALGRRHGHGRVRPVVVHQGVARRAAPRRRHRRPVRRPHDLLLPVRACGRRSSRPSASRCRCSPPS